MAGYDRRQFFTPQGVPKMIGPGDPVPANFMPDEWMDEEQIAYWGRDANGNIVAGPAGRGMTGLTPYTGRAATPIATPYPAKRATQAPNISGGLSYQEALEQRRAINALRAREGMPPAYDENGRDIIAPNPLNQQRTRAVFPKAKWEPVTPRIRPKVDPITAALGGTPVMMENGRLLSDPRAIGQFIDNKRVGLQPTDEMRAKVAQEMADFTSPDAMRARMTPFQRADYDQRAERIRATNRRADLLEEGAASGDNTLYLIDQFNQGKLSPQAVARDPALQKAILASMANQDAKAQMAERAAMDAVYTMTPEEDARAQQIKAGLSNPGLSVGSGLTQGGMPVTTGGSTQPFSQRRKDMDKARAQEQARRQQYITERARATEWAKYNAYQPNPMMQALYYGGPEAAMEMMRMGLQSRQIDATNALRRAEIGSESAFRESTLGLQRSQLDFQRERAGQLNPEQRATLYETERQRILSQGFSEETAAKRAREYIDRAYPQSGYSAPTITGAITGDSGSNTTLTDKQAALNAIAKNNLIASLGLSAQSSGRDIEAAVSRALREKKLSDADLPVLQEYLKALRSARPDFDYVSPLSVLNPFQSSWYEYIPNIEKDGRYRPDYKKISGSGFKPR